MKMADINFEEITSEKSLWAIYKQTKTFRRSEINQISTAIVCFALLMLSYNSTSGNIELLERLQGWLWNGVDFAASILGFLIAGFTIFATMADIKMTKKMVSVRYEKYNNIPYLKFFYFTFILAFIYYLIFLAFCFLLAILINSDTLSLIALWQKDSLVNCVLKFLLVAVGTSWFHLIMQLKSFIFNVYHIVMMTIRFSLEEDSGKI